jgi:hypothetical protein
MTPGGRHQSFPFISGRVNQASFKSAPVKASKSAVFGALLMINLTASLANNVPQRFKLTTLA